MASQDARIALCPRNAPATPGGAARHATSLRKLVASGGYPAAEHFTMRAASVTPSRYAVSLRHPATPSRDAVLRPSWEALNYVLCAYELQLPSRVLASGGGLPLRSVRSRARGLHCCNFRGAVLEHLLHPRFRKNMQWTARGHTSADKVLWRTALYKAEKIAS